MTSVPHPAPPGGTWYVRLLLLEGMSVHLALAAVFLGFDYITGPSIHAAITFIIPVAAAGWFSKPSYAYTLAILQPAIRSSYPYLWGQSPTASESFINFTIRACVLAIVAWLIHKASVRSRNLVREVEALEGVLPICRVCKRIRNSQGEWRVLEQVAPFDSIPVSRGRDVCPDCWH